MESEAPQGCVGQQWKEFWGIGQYNRELISGVIMPKFDRKQMIFSITSQRDPTSTAF